MPESWQLCFASDSITILPMKYLWLSFLQQLLLVSLTSMASLAAFAGPVTEINSAEKLEAYLRTQFNGVLFIEKNGKVLWKKAYGVRDFKSNAPITMVDKFQIGSVSKQFTAAAILKLQQAGKLSLADQIEGFGLPKEMTIKDVLNHSAGLENYTERKEFWELVKSGKSLSLSDIVEFVSQFPARFLPRAKYEYSNSGYIVAGKLIEQSSGKSWDRFVEDELLQPLDLQDTGYSESFEQVSEVKGYAKNKEGVLREVGPFNLSWAQTAGGLYSTAEDLARWADIYEDSKVLSEDSKKQMQTPYKGNYGLGVFIDRYNGETRIHHGGRTPGFVTELFYLKTSRLKVVKWDNVDGSGADAATIGLAFFSKGHAHVLKMADYKADPSMFSDYVGTFKGATMTFTISLKDGALNLKTDDDQPAYNLVPNDKDSFRLMGFAGEEFIRDADGKVVQLKHYQNDQVSIFEKQAN